MNNEPKQIDVEILKECIKNRINREDIAKGFNMSPRTLSRRLPTFKKEIKEAEKEAERIYKQVVINIFEK